MDMIDKRSKIPSPKPNMNAWNLNTHHILHTHKAKHAYELFSSQPDFDEWYVTERNSYFYKIEAKWLLKWMIFLAVLWL